MSEAIYKYQLQVKELQEIEMPALSEILDVQVQGGMICLWAKVFIDGSPNVKRFFEMIMTGFTMPIITKRRVYLKTIQWGAYVLHFYEHKD